MISQGDSEIREEKALTTRLFRASIVLTAASMALVLPNWSAVPVAAATTSVVSDPMSRTVAAGLGSAPTGGAYSLDESAEFSVAGSTAQVRLAKGEDRNAQLPVTALDIDSRMEIQIASIPTTGSGVYFALTGRRDARATSTGRDCAWHLGAGHISRRCA